MLSLSKSVPSCPPLSLNVCTIISAEISTNEIGTVTHEAAAASYRSSAPSVADLAAAWEASGANRVGSGSGASASSSRSQYSASTSSSGSSSSGGGSGRAAGAYGAGVGAGGGAASAAGGGGGGSFRTSSSIFSTEVRQTAPAPPAPAGPTVTPEGFVLVKASAARTAGLNVIGPEITNFQGLQGLQQQSGPAGAARPFGGARPSGRK